MKQSTMKNDIEQIKADMRRFEQMINTADTALAEELVASDAPFFTPASPEPLFGGQGYLSVVHWMRSGFSDVQWKAEEMVTFWGFGPDALFFLPLELAGADAVAVFPRLPSTKAVRGRIALPLRSTFVTRSGRGGLFSGT